MGSPFRKVRDGLIALGVVMLAGVVGYLLLGFSLLNAVYQTVLTVSTVGFGTPHQAAGKIFTIILILVGVGTALYTFSAVLEVLLEGHMRNLVRRRRMERQIDHMKDHVIVCGWGRVGRQVTKFLATAGEEVVVVDRDPDRLADLLFPTVMGDVTDDRTLLAAGIERAATLVAALDTDTDNLYLTVASKTFRPDLQIIARARNEDSEAKLLRAGADRVVNPQRLGGDRMAAFVTQPHVVEFVDVVMHDGSLEFRLSELSITDTSPLAGSSLRSVHLRDRTGALVLAIRRPDGSFLTNPTPDTNIQTGDVLIGIGTADQLAALERFALNGS
ncbi:MAG TPA: potassium channel protein [Acidimicrobiales bacterium]|nr:potassium channel protein [Acidimicrobiales bacterium]